MPKTLIHEPFDKKRHNRKSFDCGVSDLNTYLQGQVTQDIRKALCKAFVFHSDGEIVAFYTVSPGGLPFKVLGCPYDVTPGFLIGRVAVDKRYQKQGLGGTVLLYAMAKCKESSLLIAGKIVYLQAKDDRAKSFYEHYGFVSLPSDPYCLFVSIAEFSRSVPALNKIIEKLMKERAEL